MRETLEVIKKDGGKELFDDEKLRQSVKKAASDVHIDEGRSSDLADKIIERINFYCGDRKDVSVVELREQTLSFLDLKEPAVSDAWRQFEEKKDESRSEN